MANRKPPRADSEIQALATRWRTEWTPSEGIMPWLRRHLAELTELVRNDHWSWHDLARALNETDIRYATARPWSATQLSHKARELRAQQRQTERHAAPPDVAAVIRDALGAATSGSTNITINLTAGVAASANRPVNRARPFADKSPQPPLRPEPPQDEADDSAEPDFGFARLKEWSQPDHHVETADQIASATAAGIQPMRSPQEVERLLRDFLSRPRRGSIPMPSIPEPEEE